MPEKDNGAFADALSPKLGRLDRLHHAAAEECMAGFGLHRSQHAVLMALTCRKTPLTQTDLCGIFKVSPAAMAVTLKKMEAAGYVTRTARSGNARVKEIGITEKGRSAADAAAEVLRRINTVMCAGLSEEELSVFAGICDRMCRNLESAEDGGLRTAEEDRGGRTEK